MDLIDRFIEYCKIYTTSNEESSSTPSSKNQLDLLKQLKRELSSLGIKSELDEYGRLYAHLEGNNNYDCIGLCAHVDTASECSGENVNPIIHKHYNGKDIELGNGYTLSPNDYPELNKFIGDTIITTDGSTLLGADDKAGIAIIMNVISELIKVDKEKRRPISILFTPDEEIGRGPEHFSKDKFNCKYAFTIDGGDIHEISYENFNAATALIDIKGISIHPGDAKGKMVNSCLVLNEFMSNLPKNMIPSKTQGYQGFIHCISISGQVEEAHATYIIRNHNRNKLNKQKTLFDIAKAKTLKKYPKAIIDIKIKDAYRNMSEIIKLYPEVLASIEDAFKKNNSSFYYAPTRGGTDGAEFSFQGCPCPNLGTGSRNHHGRFEYAIKEEMEEMVSILIKLYKIDR